jgi:hypothetical protein
MSWLFSQALVAAYSEANSLDGTPSAPSNTTPTPQAFLSRDKTTDAWSRFPSGMTCEPLTESRGEELLTWFRAVFLAPTYRLPARAPESPASSQDCGAKWRASSARFDRNTFSWKTAPLLVKRGLAVVLGDLAEMGYDAEWGIVGARHAGAPHRRDRIWIVANATGQQGNQREGGNVDEAQARGESVHAAIEPCRQDVAKALRQRGRGGPTGIKNAEDAGQSPRCSWRSDWWDTERGLDRVAHGVAHRTHRLKAIGNGQVPAVAALAWRLLKP